MTEILAFDFEHDGVVSYPARPYITTRDVATFAAARATDPPTSHEAAAAQIPVASYLEDAIMGAVEDHPAGLTDDEIAGLFPDRHPPTVKTARSRLSRRGLLVASGWTRPSNRGRQQIVWRIP